SFALLGETPAAPVRVVHQPYTEKLPDSDVSFDMVPITGGTFWMGSPDDEPGRCNDEGPRHPVNIRPFWMGKCEVTWDEYDLFRKETSVESPDDQRQLLRRNP